MAETKMIDGITVVIPAYGDIKTVSRSVYSAATQYVGRLNETHPNIEILLMCDDIEYQEEHDGSSQYDYFTSDEFKKLYNNEVATIRTIHNKEKYGGHIYQGGGRLFGMYEAKYDWIIFFDCDDVLAPCAIREYADIISKEQEKCSVFRVGNDFLSFDSKGYRKNVGHSIWVQAWCWNREFFKKFNLTDETIYINKINRRQGEDYLMCQIADYCFQHNKATEEDIKKGTTAGKWTEIHIKRTNDSTPCGFWYPNVNSLSRQDPYYGQHLAGSTMSSSNTIVDFMEKYNKEHGIEQQEDEALKHRLLNMTVYAYFNLADFLKIVSVTRKSPKPYIPLEEDWALLRDNVAKLRTHLLKYWREIQDQDVYDELYKVRHQSDARCCNVWFANFFDFMNKGTDILSMSYKKMINYCNSLEWDNGAINCVESPQFKAFMERHK